MEVSPGKKRCDLGQRGGAAGSEQAPSDARFPFEVDSTARLRVRS